jgi:hypothetical protein
VGNIMRIRRFKVTAEDRIAVFDQMLSTYDKERLFDCAAFDFVRAGD